MHPFIPASMLKKLVVDSCISATEARELIFYFIRWGEHSKDDLRTLPDMELEVELDRRGYGLSRQIEVLQNNPHGAISWFENLMKGSTWEIYASPGTKITHSFIVDGVEVTRKDVENHAIVGQAHRAHFFAACNARDEAISKSSFDSFNTALSNGFSSIEAYFTLRVAVYNSKCEDPSKRLEEKRPKGGFVSLDQKIKEWLPIMCGITVDINSDGWGHYKYLRQLRHDMVIHPKPDAALTTLDELADGINQFRYGVGALMFLLHQAFQEPMDSSIIRAMRYPTVRVV
jgi:hypothetical protein